MAGKLLSVFKQIEDNRRDLSQRLGTPGQSGFGAGKGFRKKQRDYHHTSTTRGSEPKKQHCNH